MSWPEKIVVGAAVTALAVSLLFFIDLQPGIYSPDIVITPEPPNSHGQAALLFALEKDLVLQSLEKNYTVKSSILKSWYDSYFRIYTQREELAPNTARIREYLNNTAKNIERSAVNARLALDEESKLIEIRSPKNGTKLDNDRSVINIITALAQGQSTVELVLTTYEPEITLEKAFLLGIKKLLGSGVSNFVGSSHARINNIKIGSAVFNGTVLSPGDEFSFNSALGPVDGENGYKRELVIKNNKLIPEFGGGLCQVSTTVFRAAVNAGLPIVERHPHSLPVRYYNPQGFDAAIYPEVSDLKFKNDTPGHLLIQGEVLGSTLSFEIYGSDDDRKVTVEGPHTYESSPDGSLKTWLKRVITRSDGSQKKDMFYSSYKSPSLFPTVRNPLE